MPETAAGKLDKTETVMQELVHLPDQTGLVMVVPVVQIMELEAAVGVLVIMFPGARVRQDTLK
jgi:hypothetical protein